MLPQKIAFVDIETTGSRVNYDRIIEIGIVRIENDEIKETFQTLVNPHMYVSPFIENMTGINSAQLETAPLFEDIKDKILETISDCVFVAHNVRFDYGFIKNEFKRFGINFSQKHFCTVKLSRTLWPELPHHNLDSIIQRFGFKCERRHRAFDDAKVLWDFYQKAREQFPPDFFEKVMDLIQKKTSYPPNISADMVENLPETPGVYIFYGETGIPLYVGKSINIKDRVKSHFTNDHNSTKEMNMSREVTSIESIQTSGELGALFLESQLVKKMQPIYNRQLRNCKKLFLLKKIVREDGYMSVNLEEAETVGMDDSESLINIFKSKNQAKNFLKYIAKQYLLCEKLLGVEKSPKSCFGYQLETCKGACLGEENCAKYNLRFHEAFADTIIKPWPYKGPILIKEQDDFENKGEAFVVDKWCLMGKIKFTNETTEMAEESGYFFDFDTYKILNRFLKEPNKNKYVKPVSQEQLQQFSSM